MKNLKSVILDIALIALAVLTLGFFFFFYYGAVTGYQMIQYIASLTMYPDALSMAMALIVAVATTVTLIVLGVLSLLLRFNVIKNEKLAKRISLTNLILACFLFLISLSFLIVYLVIDPMHVQWAIITNLVVSVALVAVVLLSFIFDRKKA